MTSKIFFQIIYAHWTLSVLVFPGSFLHECLQSFILIHQQFLWVFLYSSKAAERKQAKRIYWDTRFQKRPSSLLVISVGAVMPLRVIWSGTRNMNAALSLNSPVQFARRNSSTGIASKFTSSPLIEMRRAKEESTLIGKHQQFSRHRTCLQSERLHGVFRRKHLQQDLKIRKGNYFRMLIVTVSAHGMKVIEIKDLKVVTICVFIYIYFFVTFSWKVQWMCQYLE